MALTWLTRIWALAGVLVWGPFLVHHFFEWIVQPTVEEAVPLYVIITLVLHLGMILGLIGTLFGNRFCAGLGLGCTAGFFLGIIGLTGIGFFLLTAPPCVMALIRPWLQKPPGKPA